MLLTPEEFREVLSRTEIREKVYKTPPPWQQTKRDSQDHYEYLGQCAVTAMQFCDTLAKIDQYAAMAPEMAQRFKRVVAELIRIKALPKNVPKNRESVMVLYSEAWAYIQQQIDDGLDIQAFGYKTVEQMFEP